MVRKSVKPPSSSSQHKHPKCFVKITGSRYNGTFLLNVDDGLDDAIYQTMRDIEVALEEQSDPSGKPGVSPKNCLSSVFRCFGTSDLQTKAVCNKKKSPKSVNKPAECSFTATVNKSDLSPLAGKAGKCWKKLEKLENAAHPLYIYPENSNELVMRDVVNKFRATLEHFHNGTLSALDLASPKLLVEPNHPKQAHSINVCKMETTPKKNQSNEVLKNVSAIKFSQEEVLVIQPPKLSNSDSKELEVGIEVKPKTTAYDVGQSIKLVKDKVLIGVQDGRGVLQIVDGVPKRSLQMVIEEKDNVKPSVKLSLNEDNSDQKTNQIPECNCGNENPGTTERPWTRDQSPTCVNSEINGNGSISAHAIITQNMTHKSPPFNNLKSYKSVESQVSLPKLIDVISKPQEAGADPLRYEFTQHGWNVPVKSPPATVCSRCTVDLKPQATQVGKDLSELALSSDFISPCFRNYNRTTDLKESRINRMPYLVHTLYEPRSLNNSSACFTLNKPSTSHSLIGKPHVSQKFYTSKKQIRKRKSSFSSDYSSSSKCTKIFRDIGELGVEESRRSGRKDASVAASMDDDFERIIQNMCGSSYLYHHTEPSELKQLGELERHKQGNMPTKSLKGDLLFDQWTQTENSNQGVRTVMKGKIQIDKTAEVRAFGDGSFSRTVRKKDGHTKCNESGRHDESSLSNSGLEDGLTSDSSESNKHNLVYSMFEEASDHEQLPRTISQPNWIEGKAKSSIGQKIFAALESPSNNPNFFSSIKKDYFLHSASDCVVNMAVCGVPPNATLLTKLSEDFAEYEKMPPCIESIKPAESDKECNRRWPLQAIASTISSSPLRVKSKSWQNLSLTPSRSRSTENVESWLLSREPQNQKCRSQLTATNRHHATTFNVCGILNLNERAMTSENQTSVKLDNHTTRFNQDLPSVVRSLLLPKQSVVFHDYQTLPAYSCESKINYTGDYNNINPDDNDWCGNNEAFESASSVAIQRSFFKRSFFAMRTVKAIVTRKFSALFRKLSFTQPAKKTKNLTTNDSVYVAIPLKKKRETLHLQPRIQ